MRCFALAEKMLMPYQHNNSCATLILVNNTGSECLLIAGDAAKMMKTIQHLTKKPYTTCCCAANELNRLNGAASTLQIARSAKIYQQIDRKITCARVRALFSHHNYIGLMFVSMPLSCSIPWLFRCIVVIIFTILASQTCNTANLSSKSVSRCDLFFRHRPYACIIMMAVDESRKESRIGNCGAEAVVSVSMLFRWWLTNSTLGISADNWIIVEEHIANGNFSFGIL